MAFEWWPQIQLNVLHLRVMASNALKIEFRNLSFFWSTRYFMTFFQKMTFSGTLLSKLTKFTS